MTGRVYNVCRNPNTVNSAVHTVQRPALQYSLQGSNGIRGLTLDISNQLFPCLEVVQNFA